MKTDGVPFTELRIHGVAATPPASILGLAALPTEPAPDECGNRKPDADVQIFDPARIAPGVRAFSWSSLTSGSVRSAFWILLLPYMLANVAGWAMLPLARCRAPEGDAPPGPPADRAPAVRWVALLVRVAGLLVTAIYVIGAALTFADILGYQWGARVHDVRYAPAAGLAGAGLVLALLFFRTRVRPRPGAPHPWREDFDDPVGSAWLDRNQDEMWNSPGIIARLHRLHMAFGFGLLALLGAASLGETVGWEREDEALVALAAAATLLPVVLLAVVSLSKGVDLRRLTPWIKWLAPVAAIAALGLAVARFAAVDLTEQQRVILPIVRGVGAWLAGTLFLIVAAAAGVAWAARDREDRRTPPLSFANLPALLLTGATVAAIFVVGIATQVSRLLGETVCEENVVEGCKPEVGPLVDWIAVGFTLMLAALLVALIALFAVAWSRTPSGPARVMRTVSRVTRNVSAILTLLAAIGTAGVVLSLAIGAPGGFGEVHVPEWASAPAVAVLLGAAAAVAAFLLLKLRWAGLFVAAGVVTWYAAAEKPVQVADIAIPPGDFIAFAGTIALTLPLGFVIGRMIGGLRDLKTRETVAILWDLGNFWPRWFHPLAPPTYADVAVTELRKTVDERLQRGETVLLAPHSQGSIISAASVASSKAPTERLGYLTYGSPLSRLYAQAFPAVFTRELFAQLCKRLCTPDGKVRWRNLYRPTDPIGGPVAATPPGMAETWADPTLPIDVCVEATCGQTHSNYPAEPKYDEARTTLLGMI